MSPIWCMVGLYWWFCAEIDFRIFAHSNLWYYKILIGNKFPTPHPPPKPAQTTIPSYMDTHCDVTSCRSSPYCCHCLGPPLTKSQSLATTLQRIHSVVIGTPELHVQYRRFETNWTQTLKCRSVHLQIGSIVIHLVISQRCLNHVICLNVRYRHLFFLISRAPFFIWISYSYFNLTWTHQELIPISNCY